MQQVEAAIAGGSTVLRGRESTTRAEWEAAREADAESLNRLQERGGRVEAYIAPLWSNGDAERCIAELRGFDETRVYVELASDDGGDEALAAVAVAEWLGVCARGDAPESAAPLIHAAAGLDIPLLLPDVDPTIALKALALAVGEDLTPREVETVLRGEWREEPNAESIDHARELLALL